jgi:REP-associated tyrosine transposase
MYKGPDRKRNRLHGYDYSMPGFYFVTICVKNRQSLFGIIEDNKMILNKIGGIVDECWFDLPNHYENCKLHEFIIMPNHFHGIIEIVDENYFNREKVGNGLKPFPTKALSEIIRGLKTFSSRKINSRQNNFRFQWQKSFYDRIIENENELINIREYIKNNPEMWQIDRNNPENFSKL